MKNEQVDASAVASNRFIALDTYGPFQNCIRIDILPIL